MPPRGDPIWWDVAEAAWGAVSLLLDEDAWTRHGRAARRPSRKHPGTMRQCSARHRRAVEWTATGALELCVPLQRGEREDGQDSAAVILALELARLHDGAGWTVSRWEEEGGWPAALLVLSRIALRAEGMLAAREKKMRQIVLFPRAPGRKYFTKNKYSAPSSESAPDTARSVPDVSMLQPRARQRAQARA